MQKYIEELDSGDSFSSESKVYILTKDFKKNGQRLAIDLKEGNARWFEANGIVEKIEIYTLDKDNSIIPIKPTEKEDVILKN